MKNTVLVSVLCFALLGLSMSMPIVGGKSDPQPVDDNAKAAASTVINKLNTDKELRAGLGASVESLKLVDITSVRTQVVAGLNYFLTLKVEDNHGKTFDIDTVLWSRPWLANSNADEAYQVTKVERTDA